MERSRAGGVFVGTGVVGHRGGPCISSNGPSDGKGQGAVDVGGGQRTGDGVLTVERGGDGSSGGDDGLDIGGGGLGGDAAQFREGLSTGGGNSLFEAVRVGTGGDVVGGSGQ